MLYIHKPLLLCHSGLARMLGSYATSKLMGCGLALSAFGCLPSGLPPVNGVDIKVLCGVPPPPSQFPACGGLGCVFSSSTIVAVDYHVVFPHNNLVYIYIHTHMCV